MGPNHTQKGCAMSMLDRLRRALTRSAICPTCGKRDFTSNLLYGPYQPHHYFPPHLCPVGYEHAACRSVRLGVCACPLCGSGEVKKSANRRYWSAVEALEEREHEAREAQEAQGATGEGG